jgi:hypothetical protein
MAWAMFFRYCNGLGTLSLITTASTYNQPTSDRIIKFAQSKSGAIRQEKITLAALQYNKFKKIINFLSCIILRFRLFYQ